MSIFCRILFITGLLLCSVSAQTRSLTVINDGNGTTTPNGTISIVTSTPYTISASPNTGYRFLNWTVPSGIATFNNLNSQNTTVQVTNDANIRANFTAGTILPVRQTDTLYNFTDDYYDVNPDSGVRFRFVAPETGNYCITLENTDSSSLQFFDYGRDSTFATFISQQRSTTWNLQFTMTLTAGERRYFRVLPSTNAFWSKKFVLYWAPGLSLTPAVVTATLNRGGILNEHKHLHLPAEIAPPKADIMIVMDLTGSMGGALNNVKTNAVSIMNQIRGMIPDTRFGVISLMDYNNGTYGSSGDYPYRLNRRLTDSTTAVSNAISALALGGGGDGPESYTRALYESYSDTVIGWRQGTKRFVLLWGDNLPHDLNCALDCALTSINTGADPGRDGIIGTSDDLNLTSVLTGLSNNNITFISLHNGDYNPYWQCYSQKTGGNSFQIDFDGTVPNGTNIATYLAGLLRRDVEHIDTLTLKICTPGYENWLNTLTPRFYTNVDLDTAKDFNYDIAIRVPDTTSPGIYRFNVCAIGDGAEYTSQSVTITVPGSYSVPDANAGPDQTLYNTEGDCSVSAVLNGSGSTGGPLTYVWTGPFSGTPSTVDPTVNLTTGRHAIILNVTNGVGFSDLDTMFVTVVDTIAPVVAPLPVLRGECAYTVSITPTATDNCTGNVLATTINPLTYNRQGLYQILWNYDDGNGNRSSQLQSVIIDDITAPVPSVTTLPELRSDCALTVTTIPTANDNCSGIVTATTTDSLTFTAQGNDTITWTYEDDQGNKSTQQQVVIIKDSISPVPLVSTLPELHGMCSVNLTRPQANDNCKGTIAGVTTSPMVVDQQGDHEILWTFDDGNGNRSTQVQRVIVKDSIAPRITIAPDTVIIISASKQSSVVSIDSAKAFDSCSSVSVSAVRSDGLPLDTAFFTGTTVITWKACDANGNCDSAAQSITVKRNCAPVLTIPADTSMREGELINYAVFASDTDGTVPRVSLVNPPAFLEMVIDNGVITIISRPGCTDHGLYTVAVKASDGVDSVISQFKIRVDDIDFAPVFSSIGLPQIKEQELFNLQVRVSDCDGTIPRIRIVNTPTGASFVDNRDGHGTFTWTPAGDDNGYYVVVFEAADGNTTVRDTVVIEVVDVNCFSPVLKVSSTAITTSVNLPVTILATASDRDGIPPQLKISALPSGARFTTDEALGTGIFTWTPKDTGTYPIVLTAVDAFDPSMDTNCTVMITVNNNNITGPVFLHPNDTTIEQNKEMILRIEAKDPDGTIPELYLMSGPLGARLVDNKNGTGNVIWNPACDISGNHPITVGARDQSLSDSLKINIFVRDVNCAPVINHIPDVSAKPGEIIQMSVSAYDPDNDGSTPRLSVACDIPGFTFVTSENAVAEFRCIAPNGTGLFPVVFYANDGITIDSMKVIISIGKYGVVKISGNQKGTQIFSFPSGCFSGTFLGQDSITFTASQGIYWFEVQAPGYRAQRFSCNIKTDSLITQTVTLKPSIPLMFSAPDTLTIENTGTIPESGSFSFVDLNGDGIEDLVITSVNKCMFYSGIDSIYNNRYRSQPTGFGNITAGINTLHHVFADWKNNKNYDCILSDRSGNIVAVRQKGAIDTLAVNHGASLYPLVLDVNNDGKKDLLVHSEGLGLFVYRNIGTDSLPVLNNSEECKNSTGQSLTDFKGAPVLLDLDNDSKEELIILSAGVLKVFTIDSSFSMVTYKEDLNCAGLRISADSLSMSLIGSSRGTPKLAVRTKDKILIYQSHLLGDVNYDSIINIKDISRISKQFEYTDTDSGYNAVHNLKLSDTGNEVIDIRDISRASKFWEMQE